MGRWIRVGSMLQDSPRPRRPVWKPGPTRQVLAFFSRTARALTFKSAAIVACALLLLYTCAGVFHDVLVIDPFSVPKRYAEAGLTPEVVADRIRDALRQIEAGVESESQDRVALPNDQTAIPDIE